MSRHVHMCLALLVLLNLLFVQLTGAVGRQWLLPLYGLTFAAPFLTGLHGNTVYRLLWNVGILAIFAILVVDASTSGPVYLLEDGLILAAFCQVQLLNVVRISDKADLLFFNSFLIALVTSFFCQDVVYSITFVVYAFVLLVAMQANTVAGTGRSMPSDVWSALVRDGVIRAGIVIAVTAVAFLTWPRDFTREGLIHDQLMNISPSREVGFSERVVLGRSAHTTISDRIVMRVHLERGVPALVPAHWRGATLPRFDARGWHTSDSRRVASRRFDVPWIQDGAAAWTRVGGKPLGRVRVEVLDPKVHRLFTTLGARRLEVVRGAHVGSVVPLGDATVDYRGVNEHGPDSPPLTYAVDFGPESRERLLERLRPHPIELLRYRELDPGCVPEAAYDRLREAVGDLGLGAAQGLIVERCRNHVAQSFEYLLPGEQGAANHLEEFLSGSAGGHCEYFATALATILRLRGIACRMVTGYLAEEWDESARTLTVRARHAHAWLEVWDPETGWYTVDATPSASRGDADAAGASWFAAWIRPIERWWREVTRFDAVGRARLMRGLRELPERAVRLVAEHPVSTFAMLALGAVVIVLRRRRSRRDPDVVAYERALRRAGIDRAPEETPREVIARLESLDVPAARAAALEQATHAHEVARYGRT